ncbi:MAG TPA: chemotaxis protein CheW, partial [Actinomycetes bacterium]|nr:chemotaxis protein CheW [Actinomycetes bacterium]
MSGYITFHMNGRDLACQLDEVREVVRAVGIDSLPGTRAPVSGMLELRNDPLPVIDLRSDAYPGEQGDVLVL